MLKEYDRGSIKIDGLSQTELLEELYKLVEDPDTGVLCKGARLTVTARVYENNIRFLQRQILERGISIKVLHRPDETPPNLYYHKETYKP